jgi:hypothetical protein
LPAAKLPISKPPLGNFQKSLDWVPNIEFVNHNISPVGILHEYLTKFTPSPGPEALRPGMSWCRWLQEQQVRLVRRPLFPRWASRFLHRVSSKQSNFFSFRTEKNRNSICLGCFSVCFAKPNNIFFGLFRCFGPISKQLKQTEFSRNKQKKSPKKFSIRGSLKPLIFFLGSNQNKPKLNLFQLFFGLLFHETPKKYFRFVSVCFDVLDRYRNNRNKQNLWYGELKRLIFYQICCCFGWSFVCFGWFEHRNSLFRY